MVDMTKAFGLPSGSIRAILMLVMVIPVVYLLVMGRIAEIPEWFYLLVGMIIGFYFAKKDVTTKEEIDQILTDHCPTE